MSFIRLVVFGFIGLTIVYWMVSAYSRSVRLERLEDEWEADNPGTTEGRQAFLDEGMERYRNGFRRKLILLVYIIPTVIIAAAFILTNSN